MFAVAATACLKWEPRNTENRMIGEGGCTRADMVAHTEDGREIDRQPAPICVDEEWLTGE
ncbi:MAG: hypothetical protein ACR2K4_04230 [Candidatus Limnocylindria bacterium]